METGEPGLHGVVVIVQVNSHINRGHDSATTLLLPVVVETVLDHHRTLYLAHNVIVLVKRNKH